MLYHLFYPLHTTFSFFNIFQYITFRMIYAALTAFFICFFLGPIAINRLRALQIGQEIRDDGPETHKKKAGTPTMGGLLMLISILVSTVLWMKLTNPYIWILLFTLLGLGGIGFMDDYLKVVRKQSKGLSAKQKFTLQLLVSFLTGVFVYLTPDFNTNVTIPFFKNISPDLGIFYIPFAALVITSGSNAVNLTDGLDGLAAGPIVILSVTYMIFAYAAGHVIIADYLKITYIRGCGEITIFCGIIAGAGLGFLWFNAYPAQVFMGDVGSLSLGGVVGLIAVLVKQEILLVIVGGLFVVETLSVIFQVSFYKFTKGKRIFRMAPLHHHFELKGWPEPKVIVRFWIIAIALALISLSTLKIR